MTRDLAAYGAWLYVKRIEPCGCCAATILGAACSRNWALISCNILAICRKKQETAFGGDCFILDSRFPFRALRFATCRGNDNRLLHWAKVLQMVYCDYETV